MRTTIPLLRSAPTTTPTTITTTTIILSALLPTLKAAHLQRIAQRTGVKSSGTRPVVIRRLETEVPRSEYAYRSRCRDAVDGAEPAPGTTDTMSILSIDMGIRNLAFAHLLVGLPPSPPLIPSSREPREERPSITLTAWRRLSLFDSDFDSGIFPPPTTTTTTLNNPPADADADAVTPLKDEHPEPEGYSPPLYAAKAYTLLTTLLERYRPTHVLIERQRFRSAGSAAVQEWTIRVGVLEAVLYTVLEVLRREREGLPEGLRGVVPRVWGVEPARVSRFWAARVASGGGGGDAGLGGALLVSGEGGDVGSGSGSGSGLSGVEGVVNVTGNQNGERKNGRRRVLEQQEEGQEQEQTQAEDGTATATATATGRTRKKKKSAREVKKMKMDLVGHWLQNATTTTTTTTTTHRPGTLAVADDHELQRWVQAYRSKWQSPRHPDPRTGAHAHAHANLPDIGKLDDLADCLVQGVTWLEWQQMRHRLMANPSLLDKI